MLFQPVFVADDLYAADCAGEHTPITNSDSWLVAQSFLAAYLRAAFLYRPCQKVVTAFEDFPADNAPLFIGG